jgi:hypothetical protein
MAEKRFDMSRNEVQNEKYKLFRIQIKSMCISSHYKCHQSEIIILVVTNSNIRK